MRIDTEYAGQPFQIVGWRASDPDTRLVIGWTRSPQDINALRELQASGDYKSVEYRTVKNRQTGDA